MLQQQQVPSYNWMGFDFDPVPINHSILGNGRWLYMAGWACMHSISPLENSSRLILILL